MRQKYRDGLNLLRVTIGVVNQEAQASASVLESGNYAYYSDLKRPLDNYMACPGKSKIPMIPPQVRPRKSITPHSCRM